jgi:Fic-DOC domain mobile mystery protein B
VKWQAADGQTPLDPDEIQGLRLKHLMFHHELDTSEALNIFEAEFWLLKAIPKDPLQLKFLMRLHLEMFGQVWGWAGRFRTIDKNLGSSFPLIRIELTDLLANVSAQFDAYLPKEDVLTFYHHGLVKIHPFPNGNGRFARLATEVLCLQSGAPDPIWTLLEIDAIPEFRKQYIAALKLADLGDYRPLRQLLFPNNTEIEA